MVSCLRSFACLCGHSLSFIDLHTHSTASDGTCAPAEVVRLAKASGLTAVSLTDHDTVDGLADAAGEAQRLGIDFIAGIEISCLYPRPGTMHLLGYGFDPADATLRKRLADVVHARDSRNERILKKLREQGIPIQDEHVRRLADGVVGRPHIARVLLEMGVVQTLAEAFNRFLGSGGSAYVDKETLDAKQAVRLVRDAGGIVSLAHPIQLRKRNPFELRGELRRLRRVGLSAVEVLHSEHRESYTDLLQTYASRFNLITTGGSDFHGSSKPHIRLGFAGSLRRVPVEYLDVIRRRIRDGD
jgi:3',5'-nucleoside bisphosphate phosphatase